jgi:hypothetical protein
LTLPGLEPTIYVIETNMFSGEVTVLIPLL